ncbi:MAG: C69 family dipeptidase [Anaerolineae bacterium]|nr:C69 family dipeptidase [Anaerolineae bacterium]
MCDTLVATGAVTADGVTVFGKNSDREPNEAHEIVVVPAADHADGSTVRCTYLEVPQVAHTYGVLLAKPFWIWGAEIGANEHGVTIGNEAVFTKVPYGKEDGLIGMDFLRLALERAATAEEAVAVITVLLGEHGQSGNCGFRHKLYYHNSFLIVDPCEAWVLETAGPHWAAKRVEGFYTISNRLTITDAWDLASPDLVPYAVDHRWCKSPADFSFARCYSDFVYSTFSDAANRRKRTMTLLEEARGKITPVTVIDALRDHGVRTLGGQNRGVRTPRGLVGTSVCAHAAFGPARGSQSTGSMVSHLRPDHPTHFLTGSSAPCTSLFKPVWLDVPLPSTGPQPTGTFDAATLYWQHEVLHRRALWDLDAALALYSGARDTIETGWVDEALRLADADVPTRSTFEAACFNRAHDAEQAWRSQVGAAGLRDRRGYLARHAWQAWDREAQMPE